MYNLTPYNYLFYCLDSFSSSHYSPYSVFTTGSWVYLASAAVVVIISFFVLRLLHVNK